jgi:hypothetical protein
VRARLALVPLALALAYASAACLLGFPTDLVGDGGASDAAITIPKDAALDGDSAVANPRYAAAVLADKPVLYLRLGEAGGRAAKNEVQTGQYNYSPGGIVYGTPGALGADPDTAITLDDGTGAIQMEPGVEFPGKAPFSVEVWFKAAAANTAAYAFIVDHEAYSGPRRGWGLSATNSEIRLDRWSNGVGDAVTAKSPGADGAWHHLVATYDGQAQALCLDGVPFPSSNTLISLDTPLSIAYSVGNQNCSDCHNAFRGALDELAIYDAVLTLERIRAHYAAAK